MSLTTTGLAAFLAAILCCTPALCADRGNLTMPQPSDTRGPVVSARMTVAATPEGVQATGYRGMTLPDVPLPWKAQWIAPAPGPGEALLRKEVVLNKAPEHVQAWVTAGAAFRFYVNGTLAERGPADQGRDYDGGSSRHWFYDSRDLSSLFRKGGNTLAVVVQDGAPFLFQARVQGPGGAAETLVSDRTWRGTRTEHLTDGGYHFDGTKEPVGWHAPGFDDSAWPACIVSKGVADPLTLSELPPCMEAHFPILGISSVDGGVQVPQVPFAAGHPIVVTSDGSFTVRFPRILSAYLGINVRGGAGAQIELQPNELNTPGASNQSSTLTLRDGLQYFEAPGFSSVGVIHVKVSHVTTPVEILDVSANFTSQPVAYQSSFACSDEALNALWKSCRWSTQICLQTWHLDSPQHQEPISDYGDYLIADRVAFDAFGGSPALARQDLRKWAWVMQDRDYHTFHTSYTLLWLQSLMQYYDYTGDVGTVKELSPYVFKLLDRFAGYRGKNGLISDAPNYMFMDWVNIAGFTAHHPPAVIGQGYLTAFYCRALSDAARVASLSGDAARADGYARTRLEVVGAYNRELWDPAKGLYRDGKPFQTSVKPSRWIPADTDIETWSAQNNALAVLYDIAPKDRQRAVMASTMAQSPWNVRPYFMHYVLSAMAHAGLFDLEGTAWLGKWRLNPETQTSLEMGSEGDLSHGWIATPLVQMSEQILGITPASPAFKTISVRPTLCSLQWAKGRVSTPHGPVDVSWQRVKGGLTLSVTIPPGTTADVAFPAPAPDAVITLNGKPFWAGGRSIGAVKAAREGEAVVAQIPPGVSVFSGRGLGLPPVPIAAGLTPVARVRTTSQAAFEEDLVPGSLVAVGSADCTAALELGAVSLGGGSDANALRNGTTKNGSGGPDTQDDGKTFRGYGAGSSLTFTLNTASHPAGYDLSRIATFAGHTDSRASQRYSVSVALVSDPTKFTVLIPPASIDCAGGSSEIVTHVQAAGVATLRFDFQDGPAGFCVYREIQVSGHPH